MMLLFVKLLLAHLIGDFILQPTSWILDKEAKKMKSKYLYFHVLLHAFLIFVLVGTLDFIWYGIAITILHGIIDVLKLSFQKPATKRNWFIADQILHVLVLIGFSVLYCKDDLDLIPFPNSIWILITGVVLLTKPTSIIIKNIISIWTPENKTNDDSLQNAGNYIGILERLFVFCFIITGHFEAIGFLLAAKSIFRFGDLKEAKDRKLTEYVLIGTLLSFVIAMLVGLLVNYGLVIF